jgi:hypothetical protein
VCVGKKTGPSDCETAGARVCLGGVCGRGDPLVCSGSSPVELTPSAYDFGALAVGSASQTLSITLRNITSANVAFSFDVIGPDKDSFPLLGGLCGKIGGLAVGSSCDLTMQFVPKSAGRKLAYLDVLVTDSDTGARWVTQVGVYRGFGR